MHTKLNNKINAIFFLINFLQNSHEQELKEKLLIILFHKSISFFSITSRICLSEMTPAIYYQRLFKRLLCYIYIISRIEQECYQLLNNVLTHELDTHLASLYSLYSKRAPDLIVCYKTFSIDFSFFNSIYNNFYSDLKVLTTGNDFPKLLSHFTSHSPIPIDFDIIPSLLNINLPNMSRFLKLTFQLELRLKPDMTILTISNRICTPQKDVDPIEIQEEFDRKLFNMTFLCSSSYDVFWQKINVEFGATIELISKTITTSKQENIFHCLQNINQFIEKVIEFLEHFKLYIPAEMFLIKQIMYRLSYIQNLITCSTDFYSLEDFLKSKPEPSEKSKKRTTVNHIRNIAKTQVNSVVPSASATRISVSMPPLLTNKVPSGDVQLLCFDQPEPKGKKNHEKNLKRKNAQKQKKQRKQEVLSRLAQKRSERLAKEAEKEKAKQEKKKQQEEHRIEQKKIQSYLESIKKTEPNFTSNLETPSIEAIISKQASLKENTEDLTEVMETLTLSEPSDDNLTTDLTIHPSTIEENACNIEDFYIEARLEYIELVNEIFKKVEAHGYKIYLHGGGPRDLLTKNFKRFDLLNITPHDYDFITDCPGNKLQLIFPDIIACPYEGKTQLYQLPLVDIYCYDRLDSADLKTIAESAEMSLNSFLGSSDGRIIDLCHAYSDYESDYIETFAFDLRVEEEPLLILRLVRHSCLLGKALHLKDIDLMRKFISNIFTISPFGAFLKAVNDLFSRRIGSKNFSTLYELDLLQGLRLTHAKFDQYFLQFCINTIHQYDARMEDSPYKYDPAYTIIALLLLSKVVSLQMDCHIQPQHVINGFVEEFISLFSSGLGDRERSFRLILPKKMIFLLDEYQAFILSCQTVAYVPAYSQSAFESRKDSPELSKDELLDSRYSVLVYTARH